MGDLHLPRRGTLAVGVVVCCILASLLTGCGKPKTGEQAGADAAAGKQEVVIYTALDREFSEPILKDFEAQTGIAVRVKYDTESTKSVGLANALRNERDRPRCDVFWNNEIVNTMRLANEGLLDSYESEQAAAYPAVFRDPAGHWTGFAARARVLIVNTDLVPEDQRPTSINDLADPRWKGQVGIAKPLFGTTATHAACLFASMGEEKAAAWFKSLKDNDIRIEAGNKQVAIGVAEGHLAFGLTDTDDAIVMVESGKPVVIVYPDAGPEQMGVLFIPNTLSAVKGGPNPEAARKLIDYLLAGEVEARLAAGPSAQIPVNPAVQAPVRVKTPTEVKPMPVDFAAAATAFDDVRSHLEEHFLVD